METKFENFKQKEKEKGKESEEAYMQTLQSWSIHQEMQPLRFQFSSVVEIDRISM
mgnify:CR=1 FL=1